MRNMMIDDATLNDLQITGFPDMIITDEIFMDIERARGKKNVAAQKEEKSKS